MKLYGQVKGRKRKGEQPLATAKTIRAIATTNRYEQLPPDSDGRLWCPSCKKYKEPYMFLKDNGKSCKRCIDCRRKNNEWNRRRRDAAGGEND